MNTPRKAWGASLALAGLLLAAPLAAQEPQAEEFCEEEVSVRVGEDLYDIAERCGVDIVELRRANPRIADPRVVQTGQQIRIPRAAAERAVGADPSAEAPREPDVDVDAEAEPRRVGARIHTVGAGDTLGRIAERYGVTLGELIRANPDIANPDVIHVGQEIQLPPNAQSEEPEIQPAPEEW